MGLASIRRLTLVGLAAVLAAITLFSGFVFASDVTYTVDPASGRVLKATYPDGSYITYTYDANGNRTSAAVTLATDTTAPSQPGALSFSSITATSATVSWSASTDNVGVSSYEWSRNGGSTWTNVGNTLSAGITGLTGSTSYTVLVRAKDAAGNASTSRSGGFNTSDITAPTQPGALSFSNVTATSATVTWIASTDNVGVASYEWSRNGGSSWTNVGNVLSANLTGLTGSTSYTVLVRAKDAAGNTSTNRSGSFNTADVTAPTQPGALGFSSITATSATASWGASTDNVGVTGYEWSRNGGSTWTNVGNALSASITGLTGSTNYTVLVRARDAANNVSSNRSGSFTTAAAADTTVPGAPGVPTITSITATTATASWPAATDNVGVASYEYSLNGGGSWTNVGNVLSAGLSGLTNGTGYTFQVRAKDAANNVGTPSSKAFTTLDSAPPGAPGTPTFSSITATSVTASWTAASDNVGVTSYEYSKNGGSTWTNVGNVLSTSITGLTGSTTYTIQVRAKDAAGNTGSASSASLTTSDTTAPSAPGTPTFSSITATSATASWSAASDNVGVSSYEYSLNGGGSWTNVGSALSAGLTGLTGSTSYTVQVRARDVAGNVGSSSSNSFTTSDVTPPSAPGTPGFSSITTSSATASWGASTDNVGVWSYDYSLNGGAWIGNGTSLSVNLTGLSGSTTYSFRVLARDAAGNLSAISSNSFTTADATPPSAPGTPSFSSITASSATASWAAASDNVGVSSYEWSINGGSTWNNVGSAQSASISGLSGSTTYTVHVRARDAAGNAGSSSSNSFTTSDTIAPSAPGTPSFSAYTTSSVTASWGAASDNIGVASYEWSLNGSNWNNVGGGLSASVTGLANGTTYTLQVRARDGAGNVGSASSASFITQASITIPNFGFSTVQPGGTTATLTVSTSGDYFTTSPQSQAMLDAGDWLSPKNGMSNYQMMATPGASPCSSGTFNTWISGGSWSRSVTGTRGALQNCMLTLSFRHVSDPSTIIKTVSVTITAVGQ